jgi:hypothetical protein
MYVCMYDACKLRSGCVRNTHKAPAAYELRCEDDACEFRMQDGRRSHASS